jgi:hypothetical protein
MPVAGGELSFAGLSPRTTVEAGDARVRIWFERRQREHHEYPRCEQVAAVMKNQYGEPTAVQEFDEEPSRIVG